jgi:hypothetical protein
MVPAVQAMLKSWRTARHRLLQRALRCVRPAGWALLLWIAVALVPWLWLWPDGGTERPVCVALLAAGPLALLLATVHGDAVAVLAVGLCAPVPLLVACPALLAPPVQGPVQGLALAVIVLGFVASAWRVQRPQAPLPRLLQWPAGLPERVVAGLGVAFVALAWLQDGTAEDARARKVAAAALAWLAVRRLPLAGEVPGAHGHRDRWPLYGGRRLAWLLLLGGLLWLWREAAK